MGPFNFGKKTLLELIDAGYPESVAARIASGELPMDNASKMARQQQMFPDIVYHGSMQDITGEYVPKYADNLMYTTPDPQFASEWAGKGSMQTRVGELDAFDRYRPQKQKIYEELGNPEYGTPEYDEFNNRTKEIFGQEQNAFKTVYPLAVRAQNIFDPTAEGAFENVTESIFKEKLGVDKLDPATEDYLRKGAYLYFEDPEVIKRLDGLGYDSVRLAEDSGKPPNTLAMFDGSRNARSLLSAAFDPEYTGPNILGTSAGIGTAGLLGAAAMTPEEAEASPVSAGVKAAKGLLGYHGSPHKFDKFSLDHLGSGEGAQAYGRGTYIAEREQTAKGYKRSTNLAEKRRQFFDELDDESDFDEVVAKAENGSFSPDMTELVMALDGDDWLGFDNPAQSISAALGDNIDNWDPSDRLRKAVDSGHMYEVNINASPDELLDWDAALKDQPELLAKIDEAYGDPEIVLQQLGLDINDPEVRGVNLARALGMTRGNQTQTPPLLERSGIKGIKYADAQTRFASPDKRTNNYVVFDPAIIDIARRYGVTMGVASAIAAGTITPEQAQAAESSGFLGQAILEPNAAMAGKMEDAIASDLQESQRWQAGVDKANESLQSDDPEIRELARAWLDEAGLLSDDRQAVIDARAVEEPLAYDPFGQPIYPSSTDMLAGGANYAASAAEGLARDIGGSAVGIFSPEMGRSIKDARSIPMGTEAQEFASRVANPIINAGVGAAVNELSEPVFFGRGPSPMDGLIYAATKAEEAGEMIPEGLEPYTDRAGNAIVTAAYAIPALRALMKAAR